MRHHTSDSEQCGACQEKLEGADPRLAVWFNQKVKPKFPDAHISWADRGELDQEQCFREGKTRLHFPYSPHNHMDQEGKPRSRALDLFKLERGIAFFPPMFYCQIWEQCNQDNMIWGAQFVTLGDQDHYQLKDGA